MGLLDALEFCYLAQMGDAEDFEYQLESWGEIYPPFVGDREHSLAARFILDQPPFKLFSISIPYSELPQKICLSFRAPIRSSTVGRSTSIGPDPHGIAKEFVAFLSVVTRRRIIPIGITRQGGYPVKDSAELNPKFHFQEPQPLREIDPNEIGILLAKLQRMDRALATSYVLAARLYHQGAQMLFTEPDFSYLFLVMSVEALSSVAYANSKPEDDHDLQQFLNSSYPDWNKLCNVSTPQSRERVIEMLLTKAYLTRRKFKKFLSENVPEKFWNEVVDDAKPDRVSILRSVSADGSLKEEVNRDSTKINEWEKMDRSNLLKSLDNIYEVRSRFVHQGIPLPPEIVIGHFQRIPPEAVASMYNSAASGTTPTLAVPPLITFERLTSYCMIEFLWKQQ